MNSRSNNSIYPQASVNPWDPYQGYDSLGSFGSAAQSTGAIPGMPGTGAQYMSSLPTQFSGMGNDGMSVAPGDMAGMLSANTGVMGGDQGIFGNLYGGASDFIKNNKFFSSKDPVTGITNPGYGSEALGAGAALFGAFNSYKQNKLANDTFNFNKDITNQNMALQKQTINSENRDRYIAANSANPNFEKSYGSLDTYMNDPKTGRRLV